MRRADGAAGACAGAATGGSIRCPETTSLLSTVHVDSDRQARRLLTIQVVVLEGADSTTADAVLIFDRRISSDNAHTIWRPPTDATRQPCRLVFTEVRRIGVVDESRSAAAPSGRPGLF